MQTDESPTCLVVDLRMPGLSGLDLQDLLLQQGLEMAIVFISGLATVESGIRAMKGGAIDFLEKPVSDEALLGAVRRALDQDRQRRAQRADQALLRARFETLTPRQRDVFGLIVTGLLNKQVGAELGPPRRRSRSTAPGSCRRWRPAPSPSSCAWRTGSASRGRRAARGATGA